MGIQGVKKIMSFGGWSFSTDSDTYPIFRQGVTDAQRRQFADNVVQFVNEYNLDGVDFDWE
jgi:chitinase